MANHAKLISERGGIRPVARALGHKNHTTVQGWYERDHIPERHLADVLAIEPVKAAA